MAKGHHLSGDLRMILTFPHLNPETIALDEHNTNKTVLNWLSDNAI